MQKLLRVVKLQIINQQLRPTIKISDCRVWYIYKINE